MIYIREVKYFVTECRSVDSFARSSLLLFAPSTVVVG